MELRNKKSQGCCFEVIVDNEIVIRKHNNGSCFSSANRYDVLTLNIYEPKANIDLTVNEIKEYFDLIKQTGLFLDIEFIEDYNDLEYKFVVKRAKGDYLSKFKGTYTVIRYLWGDGVQNNFDIIPKDFLELALNNEEDDLYSLLQKAHKRLPKFYNSNHALLTSSFKNLAIKKVKFNKESMNLSYGGNTYG